MEFVIAHADLVAWGECFDRNFELAIFMMGKPQNCIFLLHRFSYYQCIFAILENLCGLEQKRDCFAPHDDVHQPIQTRLTNVYCTTYAKEKLIIKLWNGLHHFSPIAKPL